MKCATMGDLEVLESSEDWTKLMIDEQRLHILLIVEECDQFHMTYVLN